jgi:RHS repeat-associated protein
MTSLFGGAMGVEKRVINSANNNQIVSRTLMRYDEFIFVSSANPRAFVAGRSGALNNTYRANPISLCSYIDIANNQYIETHNYFDKYGNLRKSVDGRGYKSQTEYSIDYACAYPTKSISPVPDPSNVNGSSAALETIISYDLNTGLPRYTIDPNNQTTEIQYNDSLLRPTKAIAPNGQQTVTQYGAATSSATRFVKNKTQIDAEKWNEVYVFFDGLGRTIKTQSVDSNGDVFVITNYDRMGRVKEVSNPFRNISSPGCATNLECTATVYDDFGRVWKVTTPDGSFTETTYALATAGAQIGAVTTIKDQSLKERRWITNALGQLIRVDEPDEAGQLGAIQNPNQPTVYAYDTLNNLTTVTQGAQTRTFVYDALARLKTAKNPESGIISYAYDAGGNLVSKTDARGVLTSYVYDSLNRIVARTYGNEPDGQTPTPAVAYFYDNIQNAKGKLVKVANSLTTTEYTAFDVSGKATAHRQTTDGQSYTTAYGYNLAGALLAETYPSGRVVKNILDADGELSMVQSKKNQNAGFWTYAAHFTYTAAGAVSSMQLGNGHWESTEFNSRLQPVQIALGATPNASDLLKLDFTYNTPNAADNNGNVRAQSITIPASGGNQGFTAIQSYTYDSLNRIKQAAEIIDGNQTWKQTFVYDRYGNRNFDTTCNYTTTRDSGSLAKVVNPEIQTSNNRFKLDQDNDGINDYLYDASGNTKKDAQNRSFICEAENKQIEVLENNLSLGKYSYDGNGKHVKKISYTETITFVYNATTQLVAEYSNQLPENPKVNYLSSDRPDYAGTGITVFEHDYIAFGEAVVRRVSNKVSMLDYSSADEVCQQYAGYERDNQSELDFAKARYYDSQYDRLTGVESLTVRVLIRNPQRFNRYVYVLSYPCKFIDPFGLHLTGRNLTGRYGRVLTARKKQPKGVRVYTGMLTEYDASGRVKRKTVPADILKVRSDTIQDSMSKVCCTYKLLLELNRGEIFIFN